MSKEEFRKENATLRQRHADTKEGGFTVPSLTIAMVIIGALWAVVIPIVKAQSLIRQHMNMIEMVNIEREQIWDRYGKPAPRLPSPTQNLPGS